MPIDGEQPQVDLVHQDLGHPKLITDSEVAQQVANTEAIQGVNAALKQEAVLTKEKNTGLTELQRKNMDVINGLMEKYPHAFVTKVSESGETFYLLKQPKYTWTDENYLNATPVNEVEKIRADRVNRKQAGEEVNNFIFSKNGTINYDTDISLSSVIEEEPSRLTNVERIINSTNPNEPNIINMRNNCNFRGDITKMPESNLLNLKDNLILANNYNKREAEKSPVTPQKEATDFLSNF